ncbi:MAG: adenylate/guanylate cyclase domain-containing protein [Actinomycetota bacterium]
MRPETRYTQSGDASIAYQVVGDGPIDLVMAPGWIFHLEVAWERSEFERMMRRFTPDFRVILFDKRGTGLSDRSVSSSSLEDRMDDIGAVMDAVGSERAALMGWSEGGTFAAMFAATYPERTRALVLYASGARFKRAPDFDVAWGDEVEEMFLAYLRDSWGSGLAAHVVVPSRAKDEDFVRWFGRYERMSVSPSEGLTLWRSNSDIDVRHILPTIRVPTLILHQREEMFLPLVLSQDLAARIPGAKYVELSGRDHLFWFGDPEETVGEILEFVTGSRSAPDMDRVLATVLFVDIVGSTERAAEVGDHQWRDLLERYYAIAGGEVERFRGRKVKTLGDGILATFDGPARAVRCAQALAERTRELGLEVRSGVHTGEIEVIGDDVGGIAVHIGSRVAGHAGPGEVVVSSMVKDLAAGSGLAFADRGTHSLRGVPDEWHLYSVET